MRSTVLSALVVSFALVGDTLLYPVLPSHAPALGIPAVWVGFLLSVNRFVRLAINPWTAKLYLRFNSRNLMVFAALLALLSTLLYVFAGSLAVWIAARLIWALSFSVLRLGSIYYAMDAPKQGFGLGLNKSVQELGPLLAMTAGPLMMRYFSARETFGVLAVVTLAAVFCAARLPVLRVNSSAAAGRFHWKPSRFDTLIFLVAFGVDGLLVVSIGSLLDARQLSIVEIAASCAFYLGVKRLLMIVVSLLAGMLADRLGTQKVFASAVFTVAIALFLTISGLTGAGIISAFIAAGIAMALAPAEHSGKGENGFRAIAVTTSWRDSGAAFGALAGGMLYGSGFQVPLFAVIAACILLRSLSYGLTPKKSTFKSIPWK